MWKSLFGVESLGRKRKGKEGLEEGGGNALLLFKSSVLWSFRF